MNSHDPKPNPEPSFSTPPNMPVLRVYFQVLKMTKKGSVSEATLNGEVLVTGVYSPIKEGMKRLRELGFTNVTVEFWRPGTRWPAMTFVIR